MASFKHFIQSLVIYIAVDIAYQLLVGFRLLTHFVESSPLKSVYIQPTAVGAALMLTFFCIIALANVHLCVQPSIAEGRAKSAVRRGAVLGLAAYGTLGLTNGWSLGGFPLLFSLTITLEGVLFSSITSGAVTWLAIRKLNKTEPGIEKSI